MLFLWLALACGSRPAPTEPASPARHDPPPRQRWPRLAEALAWPAVNPEPFASRGHLVSPSQAVVRVSPGAREAYLELVTDSELAEGTVIAMFHGEREGTRRGPVYVMQKGADTWQFLALDATGAIEPADTARCSGCHAQGVSDSLFGLPRAPGLPAAPAGTGGGKEPAAESNPIPGR